MKCDNAKGAHAAKIEIRRNVLEAVKPARVFDAFCGLGEMWRGAWRDSSDYLGCDEREWTPDEEHRRLVCENTLALRALDLSRFNVFDFDAYGSPWDQMAILAARRAWLPGERGAVVLTDGTSMKLRFGGLPHSMASIAGMPAHKGATDQDSDAVQRMALARWLNRCNVKPLRQWQAQGHGSSKGGQRMSYTAVVFAGQTASGS